MNLNNVGLLSFNAVVTADKIISSLRSVFLTWSSFKNGTYSLIMLAFLSWEYCYSCQCAFNNINMVADKMHGLKVKMDPKTESLI